VRYDAVLLDVDKTLLYVDLDVGGYVEDLAPYATNGPLNVEAARGPVWEGFHEHIRENIKHPSAKELARFRRENARRTARALGLDAPDDVLVEVSRRRISFNPYPKSEELLEELARMGVPSTPTSTGTSSSKRFWTTSAGGTSSTLSSSRRRSASRSPTARSSRGPCMWRESSANGR
jgi:phosphoglycolate phosphatase-like HAD superfamily hydrolase